MTGKQSGRGGTRSRKPRTSRIVQVRRAVQLTALGAFLLLLVLARPVPGEPPPEWLAAFFYLDPLIMLATWMAAHALPMLGLLALVTVVVTLVFGRVFCGWFCPLGTVHAAASRGFRRWWPDRRRREHWSRWQLAKYFLLAALLVMAAAGVHWIGVFDPLSLLYRTTTTALLPGAQWAVEEGSTAIYHSDPGIGPVRVKTASEPVYRWLRDHVFVLPQQAFLGAGLILVLFLATLIANRWYPRFWCRFLCPLGALLGLLSWRPLLRRRVSAEACGGCDLCAADCHGGAGAGKGEQWIAAECLACYRCADSCHKDGLHFGWVLPWRKQEGEGRLDLKRRALLASAAAGVGGLMFFRANPQARGTTYNPELIRPPGARAENDFLARCIACGACMRGCPTGALQPTLLEAGLEGIWTPRLVPQLGYCDYECNRCGQLCPTEAIAPLAIADKQQVKLGLASFDTTRCIPYAYGRECMVCEEHCPIPQKAIYFEEVELRGRDGSLKTIKQPHVDPELCIGCGICENCCPFKDRPGIRVTSANESRHEHNQPVLAGFDDYGY